MKWSLVSFTLMSLKAGRNLKIVRSTGISVSTVVSLCAVIAHTGEGALVLGLTPKFNKQVLLSMWGWGLSMITLIEENNTSIVIVAGFKGRMSDAAECQGR